MNQKEMVGETMYADIEGVVDKIKQIITPGVFYQEVQEMKKRRKEK